MVDIRCGDSVDCGASRSGAVVCTLTVTGREYSRLVAIAETLNTMANETQDFDCDGDNTAATVFAGFFSSCLREIESDDYRTMAGDIAFAGWSGAAFDVVFERLAAALKKVDERCDG